MKKLVKTAKQQFEERLRELGNHVAVEINGETFHSGIDKEGHFHILRIGDADVEYSEFDYGCTLLELYENETFLDKLAAEFAIEREGVKPILEWWSGADKDAEPFDLSDIVKFAPVKKFVEFQDIYEEVPDVRIITAKEQWEKDSAGAELCCKIDNGTIWKVLVEKDRLAFFRSNDEDGFYHRYDLPSMDNLRKDATFIADYLSLVQDMHPEDLESAVTWIKRGVYTMSACSMMDIYQSSKTQGSYEYKDKEVLTTPIEQLLELTPEQKEAVGMIENGLRMLHSSGGKIICYSDENEFYVVNGTKVHDFDNCCESDEWIEENGFTDISDILIHSDKYKFDFLWNVFWGQNCALIARF